EHSDRDGHHDEPSLETKAEERGREGPVHIDEEESRREKAERISGGGVGLRRVQDRDDTLREEDEHERDADARERQQGQRFLDHGAQLVARSEREPRQDRVEDRSRDDARKERGGSEGAVGRGTPTGGLRE